MGGDDTAAEAASRNKSTGSLHLCRECPGIYCVLDTVSFKQDIVDTAAAFCRIECMTTIRMLVAAAALAAGCATVRPADIEAWRGAPRSDLEVHPLFSTVPRTVTPLSTGGELWSYSNCATGRAPQVCNMVGQALICSGGQQTQACCHNQFVVKGDVVESYRTIGKCYTDCSVRPASRACAVVASR